MRGPSLFTMSFGMMAFGRGWAAIFGEEMFIVLVITAIVVTIYLAISETFRWYKRRRKRLGPVKECSPEMLAYWKKWSDFQRANPGRISPYER